MVENVCGWEKNQLREVIRALSLRTCETGAVVHSHAIAVEPACATETAE